MGNLVNRFLFLLLALTFSYSLAWGKPGQTITLPEFQKHVRLHVERNMILGRYALEYSAKYKLNLFPDITPELAQKFLSLHDKAKIETSAEFYKEMGYDKATSIPQRLVDSFHVHFEPTRETQLESWSIYRDTERLDKQVALKFFRENGLLLENGDLTPAAEQLLLLEFIADHVDRGLNPMSPLEFNKKMKKASIYVFLPEHIEKLKRKSPLYYEKIQMTLPLTKDMERNYIRLTKDHFFFPLTPLQMCREKIAGFFRSLFDNQSPARL